MCSRASGWGLDIVVGIYYWQAGQDDSTDELFYRQSGEISRLIGLVLVEDFNFPDINSEYHTAVTNKSWKFQKFVEDNFLSQVLSESARKDTVIDLLFVKREGPTGDVMLGVCLGHSDHKMVASEIFGEMTKRAAELLPWTSGEETWSYWGCCLTGYLGNLFLRA